MDVRLHSKGASLLRSYLSPVDPVETIRRRA